MNFHPEHEAELGRLPVDIVIDHFGRIPAAEGVDSPRFQALLRLLRREHCWAKLMGPYFVSSAFPRYPDLVPLVRAMVQASPERIVWGTDWPHPSAREKMPNDGDLADMLAEWVPDEAQRKRILVDNPQRLYGFPEYRLHQIRSVIGQERLPCYIESDFKRMVPSSRRSDRVLSGSSKTANGRGGAVALMAAIVATLAYVPVGALVAILAFGAFDVPLHSLLTFGGQIHIVAGLVLWWGIAYLPALLYAAVCMRT
jgi:hypothetical protein